MSESAADWEGLIDFAGAKPVWSGSVPVRDVYPLSISIWWKAWFRPGGSGQDVLRIGVSGYLPGRLDVADGLEKTREDTLEMCHKLLGGLVDMAWRTVGKTLAFEVSPVVPVTYESRKYLMGKIVAKSYDGKQFEPLMTAVVKTEEILRGTTET